LKKPLAFTGEGEKVAIGIIHGLRFGNYTTWGEVERHGQNVAEQIEAMTVNARFGMTLVSRFFEVCEEMHDPGSSDIGIVGNTIIATYELKEHQPERRLASGRK
jgi:hypothetical protein